MSLADEELKKYDGLIDGSPVTPDKNCFFSIRKFDTGATRDTDSGKFDYEGFFSPLVLERRAEYMNKHRRQSDGNLRDSDNWQKGMEPSVYAKSAWRHFMDFWKQHRGWPGQDTLEDSICAIMFNLEGYLHERLKTKLNV